MFHILFFLSILQHHAWFSRLLFCWNVCHCLVSIEFLLCGSVFVILHNPQSIPFPLYTPSTKFQSLHILAVLDQRSIYARTYFSLQVFLKLVTFCTFQTLAQAVIMNLVLSNVIITAFKWSSSWSFNTSWSFYSSVLLLFYSVNF